MKSFGRFKEFSKRSYLYVSVEEGDYRFIINDGRIKASGPGITGKKDVISDMLQPSEACVLKKIIAGRLPWFTLDLLYFSFVKLFLYFINANGGWWVATSYLLRLLSHEGVNLPPHLLATTELELTDLVLENGELKSFTVNNATTVSTLVEDFTPVVITVNE